MTTTTTQTFATQTVQFLDIGTPESLRQAQSFIEQNRAQFCD